MRVIILVKPTFVNAANNASFQNGVDAVGGDKTFVVRLNNPGDPDVVTRFYWCSWIMTDPQLVALRNGFATRGRGPSETAIILGSEKGTFSPSPSNQSFIFQADEGAWTPSEVLTAMNLKRIFTFL